MDHRSSDLVVLERATRTLRRVQKIEDLKRVERDLTAKLARIFQRQGKLFVGELAKYRGKFGEAITPDDWNRAWDRTAAQTEEGIRVGVVNGSNEAWTRGAGRALSDLAVATSTTSFTLKNPRAVAFAAERAGERVAGIDVTTRSYIRTLMTKAVDEGWSYDRTAKTLIARFEQFAVGSPLAHIESRAHLIAVTESAFAYEAGNAAVVASMMEGGVPMEKSWITVGDDRVDEDQCGPNEDEGWIAAEDNFQDGSSEPPAHPGCRCTAGYRVSEAFTGPLPEPVPVDPATYAQPVPA